MDQPYYQDGGQSLGESKDVRSRRLPSNCINCNQQKEEHSIRHRHNLVITQKEIGPKL